MRAFVFHSPSIFSCCVRWSPCLRAAFVRSTRLYLLHDIRDLIIIGIIFVNQSFVRDAFISSLYFYGTEEIHWLIMR